MTDRCEATAQAKAGPLQCRRRKGHDGAHKADLNERAWVSWVNDPIP